MASQFLRAALESKEFDTEDVQVKSVRCKERIGQTYELEVVAVWLGREARLERAEAADTLAHLDAMVGAGAAIVFRNHETDVLDESRMSGSPNDPVSKRKGARAEGADPITRAVWREARAIHGVVRDATDHVDAATGDLIVTLTIVPRANGMRMVETYEIFLGQTLPQIISQKVGSAGVDFELRLSETYEPIDFVVQYRETDLAFVSRLSEHHGITLFFEQKDGKDTLVFSDQNEGFQPIDGPESLEVARSGESSGVGVHALTVSKHIIPALYVELDYNYRTPQLDLTSQVEAQDGYGGGVVEYAAHYRTAAEGAKVAARRSEEQRAHQIVYRGQSSVPSLAPGARITLTDDVRFDRADLLIIEVEHAMAQPTALADASAGQHAYRNHFVAVPIGRPYRPLRVTPRPRIHGLLHAIIDPLPGGEIGEFARLDEEGRYTVRFFFDTAGSTRPISSKRVRMIQLHAGAHYGAHMPLKPGIEVMMAFVDGDPDRPVIVGSIPNPVTPSPVTTANSTMNRFKTVSGILVEMKDRG